MKKILALSLLFAVLAVPASAETEEDQNRRFILPIQSFGWKCSKIQDFQGSNLQSGDYIQKITCERNRTYFIRGIKSSSKGRHYELTFCHKNTCKKYE